MCYNLALRATKQILDNTLSKQFKQVNNKVTQWEPLFHANGFNHPLLPVLNNQLELELHQWGLIPSWVKDMKQAQDIAKQTLNARGESIFEKPSFRGSASKQRCLIPVTGFYESRWMDDAGKEKRPYFIRSTEADQNEGIFYLGGLANTWVDRSTGEEIRSFSIVTTEANSLMAEIHNSKKRMPLIVKEAQLELWLNPEADNNEVKKMLTEELYEPEKMSAYTVGKLANNARVYRNVPEVMEPFNYEAPVSPSPSLF